MKRKIIYLVGVLFYLYGSLLDGSVGLQTSSQQDKNEQTVTLDLPDPSLASSNAETEAIKFFSEEQPVLIEYQVSGVTQRFHDQLRPDPKLAVKFLAKAKDPSQVKLVTFLDDYIEKKKQCIDLLKKDDTLFNMLNAKRANLPTFILLRRSSSLLEAILEFHYRSEKNDDDSDQYLENLKNRYNDIEEDKKGIWERATSMDYYTHAYIGILKTFFACYVDFHGSLSLLNNLSGKSSKITLNSFLPTSVISIMFSSYFVYKYIKARKVGYKKGMRFSALCLVDVGLIYFSYKLFSYRFNHFSCNPIGLIALPWHYYTCKRTISTLSDPDHQKLVQSVEEEKKLATSFSKDRKRFIQLLHLILLSQEPSLPPEIADMIASYLSISLFMKNLQADFYKEIAMLPLTTDNYLLNDKYLKGCKKITIVLFTTMMLIGTFCFVASLVTLVRAFAKF